MTLSKGEREANLKELLKIAFSAVDDTAIDEAFLIPSSNDFSKILRTTWQELSERGLVTEEHLNGTLHYRLTAKGWREGFYLLQIQSDPEFKKRYERLSATLKQLVKGRSEDVITPFKNVAAVSGLPEGWIFNVIDSNLLRHLSGRIDADWYDKDRGRLVKVPLSFGIEPTNLESDHLKAINTLQELVKEAEQQAESFREQLELAEQDLQQYRCPHCNAPISEQHSIQLSEYDDGIYESFECGYSTVDGYIDSPCPSSPEFPSIDEYKFQFKEQVGMDGYLYCWAEPQTPKARRVHLQGFTAKTKEQAMAHFQEQYNWRAKRRFRK